MKTTLIWACIFGATAIAFGALGAHALKAVLTAQQLASFDTAVKYQMYHALFLLAVALLQNGLPKVNFTWVKNLAVVGVLLFSGSIYLLALQNVTGVNVRFLGPITPLGGILLMAAWLVLLVKIVQLKRQE